jgi:acetaldehyde dehydrogenase
MSKLNVGIIGSGNIGSDLLAKVIRSKYLECKVFCGRNLNSPGMQFALQKEINVSDRSIDALIDQPNLEIIFDATSAETHYENLAKLESCNALIIDMTPAKTGVLCIPDVNLKDALKARNINMVTCGGQASVPISIAICKGLQVRPKSIETVSTIASLSAGPGTRNSLDEYIKTTQLALRKFTGVKNTKALINLNPATPPINMSTTVMVETEESDIKRVSIEVQNCVERLQKYIPGMHIKVNPVYDHRRRSIVTTIGVTGLGDYLPSYAGNLDIINCAAITVAENFSKIVTK